METFFARMDRPLLFGHRGYSLLAPENTMKAFGLCVERNIPGVELDVHLCKTGELVVIHDHNLRRLSGFEGTVEELSFDALRSLDVGSHKGPGFAGERIPLLDEVFEAHGDALYYDVEMKVEGRKDTGIAAKTWSTIKTHRLEHVCMVSSFNPFCIHHFNSVSNKAIPSAVIFCEANDVPRPLWHGWGRHIAKATVLKPDHTQVDARMLSRFRGKKNYPIVTWTVNDKNEAGRLIDLGIDGIISNDPGLFLDVIAAKRQR